MARQLRIQFAGAWYHVMHRGANRQSVFLDDLDRHHFLSQLAEIVSVYGVEIHVFCLMGNHYHLVIHTPRGNLSDAMRHLNAKYTQFFNLRHSRDGSLFRGRYRAILIGAQNYLITVSRYIHLNPVEAGFSKSPLHYKWSSYKYYLGINIDPDWLTTVELKKRFGENNFRPKYRKYVENPLSSENEDIYYPDQHSPVLGSKEFCEYIFEQLKSRSLSAEIVGKDRILVPPSLDDILECVAAHFNIDPRFLIERSDWRLRTPARNIAIFLCRKAGGMKLKDIGNCMDRLAYSSVSNRVKKVEKDKNLSKIAALILEKLRKKCITLDEVGQAKGEGKT